jgi:hypothetical protein
VHKHSPTGVPTRKVNLCDREGHEMGPRHPVHVPGHMSLNYCRTSHGVLELRHAATTTSAAQLEARTSSPRSWSYVVKLLPDTFPTLYWSSVMLQLQRTSSPRSWSYVVKLLPDTFSTVCWSSVMLQLQLLEHNYRHGHPVHVPGHMSLNYCQTSHGVLELRHAATTTSAAQLQARLHAAPAKQVPEYHDMGEVAGSRWGPTTTSRRLQAKTLH